MTKARQRERKAGRNITTSYIVIPPGHKIGRFKASIDGVDVPITGISGRKIILGIKVPAGKAVKIDYDEPKGK